MTVIADRYELGEELGTGGMARVVAAHDRRLDRSVAVKLLASAADPTSRERLVREARAAARFQHPNAVTVHDAGEHDGQPFIVMERVDGQTLADRLREEGPLAAEAAVDVVAGILDALAAAHADGLVHRDVKPANVLLPAEGGLKLADFGIAKALDEASAGLTATGTVVGTPSYLAPELVQGGAATPASDVYSVGCVLYEVLVGQPPFAGDTPVRVAYAHAHEPAPHVDGIRPDVPAHVRATLDRALAKDPRDRFADAAAMRDALGGEAPVTPPATAPFAATAPLAEGPTSETAAGRAGRRRWLIGAGVAAVLLLAAVALARGGTPLGGADPALDDDPPPVADSPDGDEGQTPDDAPDDRGQGDNGQGDAGADPAEGEPGDITVDDAEPAPDDGTAGTDPSDLTELIRFLAAADPGTYGEKHGDLLDDLIGIRDEDKTDQQTKKARDLLDDMGDWVADGELDGDVARMTREVLADMVAGG